MVHPKTIEQCKKKDQRAFRELYDNCLPYVYKIVKAYIENADLRKDVIQDIFARVFLKLNDFDQQKGEFRFWLRQITVNQCRMFLRDQYKKNDFEDIEKVPSTLLGVSEIDVNQFGPDMIETYLSKMPNGYQAVVRLVVMEGYSHEAAAQRLGITASSSRSQLTRAKRWLRDSLLTYSPVCNGSN